MSKERLLNLNKEIAPDEEAFTTGREFLERLQAGLDLITRHGLSYPNFEHGRITFSAASAFGNKSARMYIKALHCSKSRNAISRFGKEEHGIDGYPENIYLEPTQIDHFVVNVPDHPEDNAINIFAYGVPMDSDRRDYLVEQDVYRIVGLRNFDLAIVIPEEVSQV